MRKGSFVVEIGVAANELVCRAGDAVLGGTVFLMKKGVFGRTIKKAAVEGGGSGDAVLQMAAMLSAPIFLPIVGINETLCFLIERAEEKGDEGEDESDTRRS